MCFAGKGMTEMGIWELGETGLTQGSMKVHGDNVRVCVMCRPRGFGQKSL